MPFTPFHMGPGILIKALLQGSFSLMVFGWAQIVMDIQPLVVLITGEGHLHGFSHTFLGATLLGAFAGLSGKYLGEWGLVFLGISKTQNPIAISWRNAVVSAYIGTFSHVVLDAIMHVDVQPYFPFSTANNMLNWLNVRQLHHLLLYTAILGGLLYFILQLATHHSTRKRHPEDD
ncbi:MAG: metal-dependent hydrolase [Pseudomonadota bacterium]